MGYCDGDLNIWPGQNYVDVGRDVVPDPALRSAVSSWAPTTTSSTPSGRRVCRRHPRVTTRPRSTVPGMACAARPLRPGFPPADNVAWPGRTSAPLPPSSATATGPRCACWTAESCEPGLVGGADVRVTALGGRRATVRPRLDGSAVGSSAQAAICAGRSAADDPTFCGDGVRWERTPHWVPAFESRAVPAAPDLELSWTSPAARGGLRLHEPVDLSGFTHLEARVIVNPATGPVRLRHARGGR